MRWRLVAVCVVVLAASTAAADPQPTPPTTTPTTTSTPTPPVVETPHPSKRAKWIAAGSIAAFHGVYLTWQHFAWYRKGSQPFHVEDWGEPGLSVNSYAGGADKFGHFWGNYTLTRATTAVLVAGGWPRLPSSAVSFGLTELAWLLIEIQDGMAPYGFDPKDLTANLLGGAFGLAMTNLPSLDRWIDFRLEYFPSKLYRRNVWRSGDLDGAQDYTGQSYMLAVHTSAIPGLASRDWGYWSKFVDVAVGFEAKHYVPAPDDAGARRTLYAGIAINMQGVLSHLFPDSTGRRMGRGVFEVYSLPYTTLRFGEATAQPAMTAQ